MLQKKREQLLEIYRTWSEEFNRVSLLHDHEYYSHPYYLHIPDNWYDCRYRILIVGEEGYGEKQFDITIEAAQIFNRDYINSQLGLSNPSNYPRSTSAFWKRIRAIADMLKGTEFSITWTNLDKIHRSGRGNCRLITTDRIALHNTPTKILSEEINILQPTHVIYFGWYGISLKNELTGDLSPVFWKLYPEDLGDYSQWKERKYKDIYHNGIHHIFTYHPGWGYRQKNYEAPVLSEIKKTVRY